MHTENAAVGLGPTWEMFFRAAEKLAQSTCVQLCLREEEQFYGRYYPTYSFWVRVREHE